MTPRRTNVEKKFPIVLVQHILTVVAGAELIENILQKRHKRFFPDKSQKSNR